MEYIDGGNILELIEKSGRIAPEDVIDYAITMTDALIEAHSLGVIHRDIKPENIMLTKDGKLKLADLGLAKSIKDDYGSTMTGVAIGTPNYISPEQVRNGKYADQRSDIYSLGASLYHMLTSCVPFPGESSVDVMMKHCNNTLLPPEELVDDMPNGLNKIICKMMEKLPEDRYQSSEEVLEAFNLLKYKDDAPTKIITGKTQINLKGVDLEEIRSRRKKKQKVTKPSQKKLSTKVALAVVLLALIPSIYLFPKGDTPDELSVNVTNNEIRVSKTALKVETEKPETPKIPKPETLEAVNKPDIPLDTPVLTDDKLGDASDAINLIEKLNIYKAAEKTYNIKNNILTISKPQNKSSAVCISKDTYKNFTIMMQYRIHAINNQFRLLVYKNKIESVEIILTKGKRTMPSGSIIIKNLKNIEVEGDYGKHHKSFADTYKLKNRVKSPQDPSVWQRLFIIKNNKTIKVFVNGEQVGTILIDVTTPGNVGFETWHNCQAEIRQLILKEI